VHLGFFHMLVEEGVFASFIYLAALVLSRSWRQANLMLRLNLNFLLHIISLYVSR
jgi:hypothetical protein